MAILILHLGREFGLIATRRRSSPEFDDETKRPEKAIEAPRNAGIETSMSKGDMPPPVPERVANPRIRERAIQEFRQSLEKMHGATFRNAYTKA